jgi:aryl-alcohol dehydrogenase-like predicted oxidoreductase/NAD-dependent dihydropyrimidine dehydrogenase PreA subunit
VTIRKVPLGKTGLAVGELVFGTLPGGPLQKGLAPAELGRVIARAVRGGVTLLDTANGYRNYAHVRAGLEELEPRAAREVSIATKSPSSDPVEFRDQLERALSELGRPRVEILYIHGGRGEFTVAKFGRVVEEIGRLKSEGKVLLGGLSNHRVSAFREAESLAELDVFHPLMNCDGLGLTDGTLDEMLEVTARLRAAGKGLVLMKALAGGLLIRARRKALEWARRESGCHAVAVGMVGQAEVDYNLALFGDAEIGPDLEARAVMAEKRLVVIRACERCGRCVEVCPQGAMSLTAERAEPDPRKCILCGYCVPECPKFAIRMI